jgi:sodium-dependent dicarboxylate transporter 2/3/5
MSRQLLVGVLLMASYAPSLGGIATPVGTAPNLIGLRLLETATGSHVSFARWCAAFAPLALLSTLLTAAALQWRARGSRLAAGDPGGVVPQEPAAPVPWSRAEKTLVPLYAAVISLWIAPGILQATSMRGAHWLEQWSARLPEACVPLLGGLSLFLLPSGPKSQHGGKSRILDASVLTRIDWSTLMLFGGGLSLGGLMFDTGLARVIGEAIFARMPIHGELGIVLASTIVAVLVSEVTTNTASASLVVPIVLALAQAAGVDPVKPAVAATVACSFGFMLPVSTPPNALVYATGRVRVPEMVRCGVWLDLAGVILVSLWVTFVAWG